MNKIRFITDPDHPSLEWDSNYKGSVSASKILEGRVVMEYSSAPRFLFEVSKNFGNLDFLTENQKEEILRCNIVSFAGQCYDEIARKSESDSEYFKGIWDGYYFLDGKRKEWPEDRLKMRRDNLKMDRIMEALGSKGIKPDELIYSGIVSSEIPSCIHILQSPEKETFISQYWQGVNILRTDEKDTEQIASDIVGKYGVVVSGSLRSLLERQSV